MRPNLSLEQLARAIEEQTNAIHQLTAVINLILQSQLRPAKSQSGQVDDYAPPGFEHQYGLNPEASES